MEKVLSGRTVNVPNLSFWIIVPIVLGLSILGNSVLWLFQDLSVVSNFALKIFSATKPFALNPLNYLLGGIILLIQWRIPAKENQKIFSVYLVQDMLWFCIKVGFKLTVLAAYVGFLTAIYNQNLSFLTIQAIDSLPWAARLALGILVGDFLHWLHHVIRHKVPWFWLFHTIHHSQRQMNLLTDYRSHVAEYLIGHTIRFLPLVMLSISTLDIVYFAIAHDWLTHFYHANIKTNLGPLRYILVTPQSHRIHHSIEARHRDMNFGVLFSVWDQIFGTQYRGYDEYPDTGVDEADFPLEKTWKGWNLPLTALAQLIYPFRMIGRGLRGKRAA